MPHPRVLHLLDTDGFAGTEQHVLQLAVALGRQGCRSLVGCRAGGALEEAARARGVASVRLFDGAGVFGRARAVREVVRREQVDLLHAHNGRTTLLAAVASMSSEVAAVATQHFISPQHTAYRGPKRWAARLAHRWTHRRLDHVIAVSAAARDAMIHRGYAGAERITTIPNGIDPPRPVRSREQVRDEFGVAAGMRLIVTVARHSPEKGLDVLLAAMPAVCNATPDVRLFMVGDGPLSGELRAQAEAIGPEVNCAVRFTGFRADAIDLIAAADVLVLPSPAEPFGLVLLEAMSLGVPVVAMRGGGPAEIVVDERTGLLVPPGDPPSLARSLRRVLNDAELRARLGTAGRARFESTYTAENMATATLDVYRAALAGERRTRYPHAQAACEPVVPG